MGLAFANPVDSARLTASLSDCACCLTSSSPSPPLTTLPVSNSSLGLMTSGFPSFFTLPLHCLSLLHPLSAFCLLLYSLPLYCVALYEVTTRSLTRFSILPITFFLQFSLLGYIFCPDFFRRFWIAIIRSINNSRMKKELFSSKDGLESSAIGSITQRTSRWTANNLKGKPNMDWFRDFSTGQNCLCKILAENILG